MLPRLDKFLLREMTALTFICMAGFSSIMVMAKIPRYVDFLFSSPHSGVSFLMLVLYLFPSLIKYALPVSLLLACTVVTMRMAAERELEAWMASGVGVLRLSIAPLILGLVVTFLALGSALFFEPYSNRQFVKFRWLQTRNFVESFMKSKLEEKTFLSDFSLPPSFSGAAYFGKVTGDKDRFEDVFLWGRQELTGQTFGIFAQRGSLVQHSTEGFPDYLLVLEKGVVYDVPAQYVKQFSELPVGKEKGEETYILNVGKQKIALGEFEQMRISLVSLLSEKFRINPDELTQVENAYPNEYRAILQEHHLEGATDWASRKAVLNVQTYLYRQIAIPLAMFFLPLVGLCLGIQDPRKRPGSVYLGLGFVILIFYGSISFIQSLIYKLILPAPALLVVTPALLAVWSAGALWWRLSVPPSVGFWGFCFSSLSSLPQRRKKKK